MVSEKYFTRFQLRKRLQKRARLKRLSLKPYFSYCLKLARELNPSGSNLDEKFQTNSISDWIDMNLNHWETEALFRTWAEKNRTSVLVMNASHDYAWVIFRSVLLAVLQSNPIVLIAGRWKRTLHLWESMKKTTPICKLLETVCSEKKGEKLSNYWRIVSKTWIIPITDSKRRSARFDLYFRW